VNDFTKLVDLASERLGGRALEANDEFFAPKSNLLKPSKPIFIEGKFTSRGKWMDGWETRRSRTSGYDWCIVRLGLPGIVRGVIVDTSNFKGNFPARFSLEALDLGGSAPYANERARLKKAEQEWAEVFPETPLAGDSINSFAATGSDRRVTHLRLKIYPDGGVARLRVYGEVVPDLARISSAKEIDLASITNGSRILASSDEFFNAPLNLLVPGRSINMGDGWETRRRRGPGHDWTIIKLGIPGKIRHVEVDTAHYKGNFPESCSIEACYAPQAGLSDTKSLKNWKELLPRTKLKAHSRHYFRKELSEIGPATHVRLNIYPDGGVSRLRLFGEPSLAEAKIDNPASNKDISWLNSLPEEELRKSLLDCCGSQAWVEQMLAVKPFAGIENLLESADRIWSALAETDWREAFRHHPPIGSKKAAAKQSRKAKNLSSGEQARAQSASAETLAQLAEANQEYFAKFGNVFLICATGKSAEEILENLRARLPNDAETETRIAAEEQGKITRLRLEKLFSAPAVPRAAAT
jgi:allantoicase